MATLLIGRHKQLDGGYLNNSFFKGGEDIRPVEPILCKYMAGCLTIDLMKQYII